MSQQPGKGIYLWKVDKIEGGDPVKIAAILNDLQMERVDVKVAESYHTYKIPYSTWGRNVKPEWLKKFREHFLGEVWGWSFLYGYSPAAEGKRAASEANELELDGYGMDVEGTFERQPNAVDRVKQLMDAFKADAPDIPVTWVSWPLYKSPYTGGSWHNIEVAKKGMEYSRYGSPMVYWPNSGPYWVKFWLENCLKQWSDLITDKPIIPIGRSYNGSGGIAKAEDISYFGKLVRDKGLFGESFWALRYALEKPELKEAIKVLNPWEIELPPISIPVPAWRNEITIWARTMGYAGPFPILED